MYEHLKCLEEIYVFQEWLFRLKEEIEFLEGRGSANTEARHSLFRQLYGDIAEKLAHLEHIFLLELSPPCLAPMPLAMKPAVCQSGEDRDKPRRLTKPNAPLPTHDWSISFRMVDVGFEPLSGDCAHLPPQGMVAFSKYILKLMSNGWNILTCFFIAFKKVTGKAPTTKEALPEELGDDAMAEEDQTVNVGGDVFTGPRMARSSSGSSGGCPTDERQVASADPLGKLLTQSLRLEAF
uniref:Uncharacterized protein n=1 Tax=Cannabis sativa TaxID=3483 RepID=A0A803Q8I2_CANSA